MPLPLATSRRHGAARLALSCCVRCWLPSTAAQTRVTFMIEMLYFVYILMKIFVRACLKLSSWLVGGSDARRRLATITEIPDIGFETGALEA